MAPPIKREEQPRWLAILEHLEAAGVCTPAGYRVGQLELAADTGIPARTLKEYLREMEQCGVLSVTRTTIDGSWGSPRANNLYRMRCTAEQWRTDVGPRVIEAKRAKKEKNLAARRRLAEMEKARVERARVQAQKRVARPSNAPVIPAEATVAADAAEMVEGGDDLDGW